MFNVNTPRGLHCSANLQRRTCEMLLGTTALGHPPRLIFLLLCSGSIPCTRIACFQFQSQHILSFVFLSFFPFPTHPLLSQVAVSGQPCTPHVRGGQQNGRHYLGRRTQARAVPLTYTLPRRYQHCQSQGPRNVCSSTAATSK